MLVLDDLRCEYLRDPVGIASDRPRFGWMLSTASWRDVEQAGYRIQVALEGSFAGPVWDSGQVASSESVSVAYAGPPLRSRTRYFWQVRVWTTRTGASAAEESPWSAAAFFETALGPDEWKAAFVSGEGPESWLDSKGIRLRRKFTVSGKIASARLYASALGLYELRLNGMDVGDEILAPGWTAYASRLRYQSYDVTGFLLEGDNALCATTAPGWYKGDLAGWLGRRNVYGCRTALIAQLMIHYADGRQETFATDPSWRAREGPLLYAELYHGEVYDARLEDPGWYFASYDDSRWRAVEPVDSDLSLLVPADGLPLRKRERFKAVSLIVTPKGEKVLDFGQNIAGIVRFTVSGKAGDRVLLRHAEVLDAGGNFYTANLRSAKAKTTYVLKGEGMESYEPRFTYMGFRYVCVDAWPGTIDPEAFEAIAIYSDMEETGSFECSNGLLNRLHANIVWGLKGNFVDIPTDCPQRDERLGWTGDAQVFVGTAAFLMGVDPFFRSWLRDLAAEQTAEGGVPFVIPNILEGMSSPDGQAIPNHSSCGWGDAATICPWTIYLRYADRALLEEQYPSMRAWVEYIRARARGGFIWDSGFHFGDWVALDAREGSYFGATPNDFTATAFYAKSVAVLAKAATVLGREADAHNYDKLLEDITNAFRKEYFSPDGRIAVRTQTACVLALDFGLASPGHRDRVRDTLLSLIKENDGHLVTGFLGTPYLCRALADSGALDAAYELLLREAYPSWLYQVGKGATTVWEHWDGLKPDGSMWSPDMNSFNHYAYGSVGEWMHSTVAGIAAVEGGPGYRRILFEPRPGGGLTWARASLKTVHGLASIEWRLEGGEFRVTIRVPHNARGCFVPPVPGEEARELGSGEHRFAFPWKVAGQ